ncbi:hypothetical protein BDW74DRAFT_180280 [Aspergillus multicolor]|uniref:uncharacterized protein n=1 Tax=Aspergillus multicolor TaxID=41759 RepID=UPI003CCD66F0
MSSSNIEDSDPHSSGYEADISDELSEASTVTTIEAVNKRSDEDNEPNQPETGTIWIGCDVRVAGPGVQSDENAEFGTIMIGCSLNDLGFDSYQAYLAVDDHDQPTVEHIEVVGEMADVEDSNIVSSDASSKKSRRYPIHGANKED